MPDAIITSTASTFGTISGTFAADQSTIVGTVAGSVVGNLSGSVGVPGPAGPGVPAGGTAGQYLQKIDGVDYNTDWVTLNLSAYAPLNSPAFTGNPTAPTAALGDNDTSLATTAFVQQELLSGTANARNLEVYVRNQTGSTLAAGAIVYINGATGNRPTVTLAQANNDANSAQTMGFVKTAIANNGFGYVIVRGECENLDTQALTEGVQLYLSPTTPGAWTTTKPSAPQHLVYVGIVIRSHPTQGVILVAVQNGYELNELHDVAISSPTNGQVLKYDSATNLWKNQTDSSGVAWGGITGTLSSQTDLQTALDGKYSTSNPAGYITSSALAGYATESWVTSQGYITSSALTGYATESWVTSQGYLTSSDLTPYALLSGASFTGEVVTPASTTSSAGFMLTPGVAPTTPVNGEFWATTTDLQVRLNGTTETLAEQSWVTGQGYITSSALTPYAPLAGATFTGLVNTVASTTTTAGFRIPHGTAPTAPVNGDIWTTTTDLLVRLNGTTRTMVNVDGTQTISGSKTFSNVTLTFGNSTAASTVNIATGATISASTKTVNIGTSGVAGSTTNITIGSTTGTSTTTLQGTTNGVTAAADTNSVALATTAFVVGQAGSATPLVNGTAAVGTSLRYARQDHVHPTDTTRAALASPTFTGTPAAPTAAADTNTTQIATTAFVVAQAGSATPLVNGTAAVGTSLRYARQDHVHPTDTSRAPLASPAFTGTPTAPTAAVDTNTTQLATTAYVVGQGYLKSATASNTYAPLASPALTGTPTAPTATAGTNTTQLATTAFVTSAVPAFATLLESVPGTLLDNKVVSPLTMMFNRMHGGFIDVPRPNMNYATAGTGASVFMNGWLGSYFSLGSIVATGSVIGKIFGTSQADQQMQVLRKDTLSLNQGYNFSKLVWLAGRAIIDCTDANVVARITLGKANAAGLGDLATKGIGIRKQGPTGAIQLMVHDGTTLTTVSSSITANGVYDIDVVSLGNGTVNLYIDKVLQATTSAGPVGNTTATSVTYQEEIQSIAVPTVNFSGLGCSRMKIYSSW